MSIEGAPRLAGGDFAAQFGALFDEHLTVESLTRNRRAASLIVRARVPATASVIKLNPAALTFASEASRSA